MTLPPTPIGPEVAQWLNLLRTSPAFVLFEGAEPGNERLEQVEVVLAGVGNCWISGQLATASHRSFEAVHVVSTNDGGQVVRSYVWIDDWYSADELGAVIGEEARSVYPLRYSLAVPLEEDRYST